jgi:acetolactate synthase I/III small subunit
MTFRRCLLTNRPAAEMWEDGRSRILSVEVEDHPGVLSRVSGMIRRRGFNIEALAVGLTHRPGRSRITLAVHAGHAEVDQVEKQLDRLIEVVDIEDITVQPERVRELVLVRLSAVGKERALAEAEVEAAGGRVIEAGRDDLLVEIAGEARRVRDLLARLEAYGILELARSGPVALSKGGNHR